MENITNFHNSVRKKSFGGTFTFSNCHIIGLDTVGLVFLVSVIAINSNYRICETNFHLRAKIHQLRRSGIVACFEIPALEKRRAEQHGTAAPLSRVFLKRLEGSQFSFETSWMALPRAPPNCPAWMSKQQLFVFGKCQGKTNETITTLVNSRGPHFKKV
jgi:hypothetical protein